MEKNGLYDNCIYFQLNALTRKLNKMWEDHFESTELSPAHAYAVKLIGEKPGILQKEVARALLLDASTVTRFIDSLENKKLVLRGESSDGRCCRLELTAKGKSASKEIEKVFVSLKKDLAKKYEKSKIQAFVDEIKEFQEPL